MRPDVRTDRSERKMFRFPLATDVEIVNVVHAFNPR